MAIAGPPQIRWGILSIVFACLLAAALPVAARGADVEPAVVGGEPVVEGEFGWVGSVGVAGEDAVRPFCGGSLISARILLTAAHCLQNRSAHDLEVVLGRSDLGEDGGERIRISSAAVHPRFDPASFRFDAALLVLERPSAQTPVAISGPGGSRLWRAGASAIVTGWGATGESAPASQQLLGATVRIFSHRDCRRAYWGYSPASMLCAGQPEGGVDACSGDSGGPLAADDGDWTLIGIVSWGRGCARPGVPGIYTRVGARPIRSWVGAAATILSSGPTELKAPQTLVARLARHGSAPAFRLRAPGSRWAVFECRFDRGPWLPCEAFARAKRRLRAGRHRFRARAINALGAIDRTPARITFRVPSA